MSEDEDEDARCSKCGTLLEAVDCWKCGGEGVDGHDCGEDTCCCLNPDDNVECDNCGGTGRIPICPRCHPEDA